MKTCIYDNPATMQRECWEDGKLLCSYSAEVLTLKWDKFTPVLFMGANVGDWQAGKTYGDVEAIHGYNVGEGIDDDSK